MYFRDSCNLTEIRTKVQRSIIGTFIPTNYCTKTSKIINTQLLM